MWCSRIKPWKAIFADTLGRRISPQKLSSSQYQHKKNSESFTERRVWYVPKGLKTAMVLNT